jgi:sulfate-transporting ATPase
VLAATFSSALILLSLVVVTGIAGQLSLAQYAFAGTGAYVAARLSATFGLPFLAVLIIAALVAVPVGVIVGLPAVRVRGSNLAIVTLVVSLAISSALLENPSYTGGNFGLGVQPPTIFGIAVNPLLYANRYAFVCLVVLVLALFMVRSVRSGAAGRRMLAVRANERAASALGVSVTGTKLYAFSLSASIAAVAGVLIVFQESFAIFSNFTADNSILAIVFLVLSGVGYLSSTFVGGAVLAGGIVSYALSQWTGWSDYTLLLVAGVLLMVSTVRTPHGGIDEIVGLTRRVAPRWMRTAGTVHTTMTPVTADLKPVLAQPAALSVRGLSVAFGGVRALTDVSVDVRPGQVVGLIGPNGAGKTTLIDAISGFVPRYSGSVTLDGKRLDGLPPHRRSAAGIGRSFQSLELFEDMTVGENLQVASDPHGPGVLVTNLAWPGRSPLPAVAAVAASQFELAEDLDRLPSELSYGRRRTLSIARAIAAAPRCLLLDEPAAGLDQHERGELADLILRIAHEWGLAVLVVEHDVELVLSVSDTVIALDFGLKIAEGTPDEIRRDAAVIRSYIGGGEPDDQAGGAGTAGSAGSTGSAGSAATHAADSGRGRIGSAS